MFEIFKAGTRTDNNNRTVTITEADVAAAASAYNPELHEAPIVVGHPATNAPAFGWVGGLKAEGGTLYADFAQVDDGFAELVKAGRYKKVSASFYPPDSPDNPTPGVWALRHVGFLGAQPPAVKGLSAINFAEGEVFVEFSEYGHRQTASVFRRLREWLIEKYGQAAADRVVDNWDIEALEHEARAKPVPEPSFSESTDPEQPPTHEDNKETDMATEEQLAAEKAAREKAEAEAAQAKAELKKLQEEQEKDLRDADHQKNADFAEGLVKAGRLKPADKELVVQVLDFAEHPGHYTADFGEGGAKKPLAEALRGFLEAVLGKQIAAGETAVPHPVAFSEGMSHHERALALSKAEGISYAEAARRTAD